MYRISKTNERHRLYQLSCRCVLPVNSLLMETKQKGYPAIRLLGQ